MSFQQSHDSLSDESERVGGADEEVVPLPVAHQLDTVTSRKSQAKCVGGRALLVRVQIVRDGDLDEVVDGDLEGVVVVLDNGAHGEVVPEIIFRS